MPFTFSHPALILPLTRGSHKWVSVTGLVVGSMTPDFEYFIRMGMQGDIGHTLPGLFWLDVPLGLAASFLFHDVIRNRLYGNLPKFVRLRVFGYKTFNWNAYFIEHWQAVLPSILIGAVS